MCRIIWMIVLRIEVTLILALDPLISFIENQLHPYQVTVFQNLPSAANQSILQEIVTRFPTGNINLNKERNDRALALKVYRNPRAARMLYVMLQRFANITETEDILGTLVKLAPGPSRPKCMLIILDNLSPSESYFKQVFRHAWSLNFLEFVVLHLASMHKPVIISYDPFKDETNFQDGNSNRSLFPDKLRNVNQYPLKIPLPDWPPKLYAITNNVTGKREVICQFCKPIDTFVQKINASIMYIAPNETTLRFSVIEGLFRNELSLYPVPNIIGMSSISKFLVPSKPLWTTGMVFVVPLMSNSKLNVSADLLLNLVYAIAIVISFKVAAFFLKLSLRDWSINEIIQLFLGVSLARPQPSRLPDRIVYLSVALLSMKISSDLLANFTDVKILKVEVPFENLDDIRDSGLPIEMPSFLVSHFINDSQIVELHQQIKVLQNSKPCYEDNKNKKPTICIMHKDTAIDWIPKHLDSESKRPLMKIAKPLLLQDLVAYPFEASSPYVDKFNDLLQRLVEAGLIGYWFPEPKKERLGLQELLVNEADISVILLIVLLSGSLLAALTFLVEILYFRHRTPKPARLREPSLQLKMFSKKDNKCIISI